MKKINITILIVFLLIFSCKRSIKHSVNNPYKTTKDTLVINNEDVLIVYPSEKEILKLKKELGEDIFYLTADGENGYISHIYEILDNQNIKYKMFNNHQVVFSKKHNIYINKVKIDNPWGIILLKNGEYEFYSTIRFLTFRENKIKNTKQVIDIEGTWKAECIEGISSLLVRNKTSAYLDINKNNDFARVLVSINNNNNNTYNLSYDMLTGITRYNEFVDWLNISHDSIIGNFTIENENIKFNWLGFYNNKTKKRVFDQNIFKKKVLEKCEK